MAKPETRIKTDHEKMSKEIKIQHKELVKLLQQAYSAEKAAAFAYRGKEINSNASYPVAGSVRGNSKSKDWYYTTGIRLSYSLSGNGNGGGSGRKSKVGCPVNVY